MRSFLAIVLGVVFFLSAGNAFAFKADHFKGAYEVFSEHARDGKKYFVCDVDTVGNIWAKYGEGPLPADLVPIKDEPSVLAAFTFRKGLFFTLERNVLVWPEAMSIQGHGTDTLQLKHRPDGRYDLAVRIDGEVKYYDLGSREPI